MPLMGQTIKERASRVAWLDYLRGFITVLVVAHHSSLAYTTFASFNKQAYILSTHPVVDTIRWKGLDIFEDFNDVFFMSLMFFISGIFVLPALKRKGSRAFLRDRFYRLFIPFIIGVTLLMPLAYYPAWLLAHGTHDLRAYLIDFFIVEAWPVGPPWFIWVLFFFNLLVAAGYAVTRRSSANLNPGPASGGAHAEPASARATSIRPEAPVSSSPKKTGVPAARHPLKWLLWGYVLTWCVYIPPMLAVGPDAWTGFGPFDFQLSRILLYLTYFMAGMFIGDSGLERGLFTRNGGIMTKASSWVVFCLMAYAALKGSEAPLLSLLGKNRISPLQGSLIYRSIWVLSCTASSLAFLVLFRRVFHRARTNWDSLAANAYGIYLVHYIFVVWCQYLLLPMNLPAVVKFLLTFLLSLMVSWWLMVQIRKIRWVKKWL
jgi:hypothetical protein